MKKIIGVITARMSSTRLPGKVLLDLSGKSVFSHHVERMREVEGLSEIYLATSLEPQNKELVEVALDEGIQVYVGAEEDIVERHVEICAQENADAVIRVTGDMPLFHIDAASEYVSMFNEREWDYINSSNMTAMQGTVPELISRKALLKIHEEYRGTAITQPIKQNLDLYDVASVEYHQNLVRPEYRLTLDYNEDYMTIMAIYNELYEEGPISLFDVYKYLDDNPTIAAYNSHMKMKDVNVFAANLVEAPLYSIVESGSKHVILDKDKCGISYSTFQKEMKDLFKGEE